MKTTLYYLPNPLPPFSNFITPPPYFSLQTPPPLLFLLSCWMGDRATFDVFYFLLNYIMDLHMLSLGTVVPEGPWCVFYSTRHQVYWGLTHNVTFCWYPGLISHTLKHTQHTQGPLEWHIHINIYLHHLLCTHSSYLNSLISKIYFRKCLFFSKIMGKIWTLILKLPLWLNVARCASNPIGFQDSLIINICGWNHCSVLTRNSKLGLCSLF